VSAFESIIWPSNCHDTAYILWQLDERLASVLNVKNDGSRNVDINDGCDLAVLFISNDGSVTMSAGHTDMFVCDGQTVTRHKGQKIFVGECKLKNKDEIIIKNIPANPDNKFYIASDGLYDQIGGDYGVPFGYDELERIILTNHYENHSVVSDKIWQAFEDYRGNNKRRDDLQFISFTPKIKFTLLR